MTADITDEKKYLRGKVALVTGSSRGIGRGIALRLAERGVSVVINFIKDEAAAQDTLAKIQKLGVDGLIVQADVSNVEAVSAMIDKIRVKFGHIDIFVNNALGDLLGFMSPPLQVTLAQWDEAYNVQCRAFLHCVQGLAALIKDNGRILSISYAPGSQSGGFLPYFAMGTNKAAVEAMSRYFAVALAPRGITVNTICAGITEDSIVNQLPKEAQDAMFDWLKQGWNPNKRPGTPADIGGAVAALCTDDAAWITGQTIIVDGGATLMSPEVPLFFQLP